MSHRIISMSLLTVFFAGICYAATENASEKAVQKKKSYVGMQYKCSTAQESVQEHDERMKWFREARFGLFIHWGIYSQLGGEWRGNVSDNGEWVQAMLGIPTSEYQKLTKTFNPVKYDPEEWASLFKAAGLKYICITSKHHDGFCLWDSDVNKDWDIAITPYKKDMLAPLAEACRKEGITYCIYHSVLDWHHPFWPDRPGFNDVATGETNKERFVNEYLYPQLKELFTKHGQIGMIWFDGTWSGAWGSEDGKKLEEYTRSLQPSVIINNRSGYNPPQPDYDFKDKINNKYGFIVRGDYITPERDVPPVQMPGMDWETCQTMWDQNTWGYHRLAPYRSTKELLHLLIDIVAKGGNLLLNVGPTAEGEIPIQARELLLNIGQWLDVNGDAIYGTTASPFEGIPFAGRCTRKGNTLYLIVYDWPTEEFIVPVKNKVTKAWLLADAKAQVKIDQRPGVVALTLPTTAPDPIASVVAIEIDGEPIVSTTSDLPVELKSKVCKPEDAKLCGIPCDMKIEEYNGIKSIGWWIDSSDWVEWTVKIDETGEYNIIIDLACKNDSVGSKMTLTVGGEKAEFTVPGTGDNWTTFVKKNVDKVTLTPGEHTLVLKANNKVGKAVVNIRTLVLEPVE